jgi:hypothetical protein
MPLAALLDWRKPGPIEKRFGRKVAKIQCGTISNRVAFFLVRIGSSDAVANGILKTGATQHQ